MIALKIFSTVWFLGMFFYTVDRVENKNWYAVCFSIAIAGIWL